MEGFPSTGDDLQLLCNKGLFPDAAVILQLESKHIVERILPGKMEIWKRKRAKLLEKKALAKEKKTKEWVCVNVHVYLYVRYIYLWKKVHYKNVQIYVIMCTCIFSNPTCHYGGDRRICHLHVHCI